MAEAGLLLDTCVLVDLLRGNQLATAWLSSLDVADWRISAITVAELLSGARDRKEQVAIESELKLFRVVLVDEAICQLALQLYAGFRLSHGTGFFDCVIAATASNTNLIVATHNVRHFAPLPAVQTTKPF